MKRIILLLSIISLLTLNLNATTWFSATHTCPICKHKHKYKEIGSYGSYIYQWDSKYQYVFWPLIDSQSVYLCPKCHFTTYMWDFDTVPDNKVDSLANYLSTVKLEKENEIYFNIPMTTRLEIAENVYKILGKDNQFWCKFYRVQGYHYDQEKDVEKAKESRLKSLEYAKLMLSDTSYAGQEKEIFVIKAAMYNFVGQKDSALTYLDKAEAITYKNKKWEEENSKGLDEYLTELIKQYKELIHKEDKE